MTSTTNKTTLQRRTGKDKNNTIEEMNIKFQSTS